MHSYCIKRVYCYQYCGVYSVHFMLCLCAWNVLCSVVAVIVELTQMPGDDLRRP